MDSDNSIPDAIQIGDETQPRTLYVGNLDAQMTEEFLVVLFSQIGPVKGCKIIHEVLLVVGSTTILWELASAHRPPPPPPPRHALRLQRMAPRLPHHHRPPRHHQHHPNMIHNQQGKPPRSYKPRLHLPFFNGLTGGRGPPPNRPHHHHHHHHPHHGPHHHHGHPAPGGHPGHPGHHGHHPHHHQNHPGHAHHGLTGGGGGHQNIHPQHQPQYHPPTRQQISGGSQVPQRQPMFPYGGIPGVRPPQPQQHQQPFGYPSMDTTPAHTSPAASPTKQGPQHQGPLRQFAPQGPPSGPQFGFQQDPEILFSEGQELPSTTGGYQQQQLQQHQQQQQHQQKQLQQQQQQQQHQQQQLQQQQLQQQQQQQTSNSPAQPAIQQTTSAYGETSTTPHGNGFLGSQYKGWKPIAKPFQSSYPRGPGGDQHPPMGLHDFARGPPQDFPQLSDNNLPAFPMHDFPSGPSGPPGPPGPPQHHQHPSQQNDFPRGPQIENMLEAFGIPDPPQIPNFSRAPQQQHLPSQHHQQQIHLPDFPQHPHPHDGPIHFSPPYRGNHAVSHHPGHHGGIGLGQQLGGGGGNGLLGFHQHSSPSPINHQNEYGQVSSTTPRDIFPQFLPSGGGLGGGPSEDYNNLNTNTLFRENIMHMKPHHGNQNQNIHHSPGGNDVVVPLPAEIGDSVRLPNSLFTDNEWTQNNREQPFEASQSEENAVVKKPKFSFKNKLNQQNNGGGGSSDETVESPAPHSVLPKFKQRPRLNKDGDHKGGLGNQNDDGSQKLSTGSDEHGLGGGQQGGQGQRNKLNGGRGRVRIRTRLRRPNPFSNSAEDNDNNDGNNGPGSGGTSSFPPFPGSKNDSPRRPIFRKQQNDNQRDNNLSSESPNNSAGDGPPGPPGPPPPALGGPPNDRPQGPISEELSNFPNLPFPPPDPDFIRDFPSAPAPVPPPPPPPPPPSKERDLPSRLSGLGRPSIRGPPQVNSGEQNNRGIEGPPGPRDAPRDSNRDGNRDGNRDNNQGSGRLNIGRRRRPRPKPQQEQDDQSDGNHQENSSGQRHRQRGNSNDRDSNNPETTPPVVGLNNDFSNEFFFPPGFSQDPTKHSGDNPVSFITMPNAKPQVIHHNVLQTNSHEQQGSPPHHNGQSSSISPPPQHNFPHHQGNQFRGPPQTQHFPPLEDFGQQGLPQIPFGRQPHQGPHQGPHHGHHGLGHPPNHQLSAYSDHLPFARPPQRGRKPHRGNHPPPQSTKAPTPQQVLNPYAYPTANPYAVPPSGPYLPSGPFEHQHLDNAPQTSNSYEVPDGGIFGARPPPSGPVFHAPPPHHGPGLGGPVPSPLPPQRPSHPPPPGRGRLPGGGRGPPHHPMHHHGRKPPVQSDPVVMSQSVEFEQIPAQYLDANSLAPPSPVAPVVVAPPLQQETPAFSDKPHEHHSPDIHPPGNFFDEFFKPFEGEPAAPGGPTQRVDGMEPHDEQQSNSNVQLKVVPSPKNANKTEEGSSKPWNKSKLAKDSSKSQSEPTSSEKPTRSGKKPINGRFHPKSHLKAKIADIARKNFQSHMATAPVEGEEGHVPAVTTYKPSLLDSNNNGSTASTNPGDQHHSSAKDSITKFRHSDSDDQIDTNTPRSTVRYSSKTDSGPMLIHHRGNKNRNDDQHQQDRHTTDGTTILFKSKRQFRRKRPGQQQKDKDAKDNNNGDQQPHNTNHELSTTTRSALRAAHNNLNKGENVSNTQAAESVVKEGSEGSTTRVGVLRRRKLFPRRRNFSLSSKLDKGTTKDATPTPTEEGEAVTYGESQWFRVKNHDDSSLSSPAPTPESKTVSADAELPAPSSHLPGDDIGSSSNLVTSSSKSRKNLHLSENTTITSSVTSSSSDSGRPFSKKSSKFVMNRLTMA